MPAAALAKLEVTSPSFRDGGELPMAAVFNGMGLSGGNLSPPLQWSGAPAGTKSYAIILHDPDAPTGVGFFHWLMWDIPADVTSLPEGAGSADSALLERGAVLGHTDFGGPGYGGAAPPPGHGKHHYQFSVYALNVDSLELGPNATGALLRFYLMDKVLADGTVTALFGR